jgi:hypothetical protein
MQVRHPPSFAEMGRGPINNITDENAAIAARAHMARLQFSFVIGGGAGAKMLWTDAT